MRVACPLLRQYPLGSTNWAGYTHYLIRRGLLGNFGIYELPEIVREASVSQMSIFGQDVCCEVKVLGGAKKMVTIIYSFSLAVLIQIILLDFVQ